MTSSEKRRVIAYVDGFNLYFGIIDSGHIHSKWLNVKSLIQSFLSQDQELIEVKYFTSMVSNDSPKEMRQRKYISALESVGVRIFRGKYEQKQVYCNNCSNTWWRTNEKMTDVNIATQLIMDAVENKFDVAILISGDSDLVPAISIVNEKYSPKYVTVFFPPGRENISVKNVASGSFIIGRKKIKDHQFPEMNKLENGYKISKPDTW